MYYKDKDGLPFFGVSKKTAISRKLIEITKEEFDDLCVESSLDLSKEELEQAKMLTELNWIDVQLKYNASNDELRSQFTNEQLYSYAIACRDYVRHIDNVLTIVGDKPERPQ